MQMAFVNLLGHDASHVDGKEGRIPLLLLRGRVNRKELQGEPTRISQSHKHRALLGYRPVIVKTSILAATLANP